MEYLSDYLDRVHPLLDQNALYEEIEKEFEDKWLQGNFPGWRVRSLPLLSEGFFDFFFSYLFHLQKDTGSAMAKHSGAQLDLTAFSSPEELMSLGLDRLKSALMALGLKCGGYAMFNACITRSYSPLALGITNISAFYFSA